MFYVTQGYTLKEFETKEQAFEYIDADVKHHNLAYKQIYNQSQNCIQVIIFQYYTLYLETYIIHNTINLTDKRSNY